MHEISKAARRALLEQHGNFALAYSIAFQPDLSYFGDALGFLSYKMVGRTAFVLSDPIGPPEHRDKVIDGFLATQKDVSFWQVSHAVAQILSARGFFINELGCETLVDLTTFSFAGPHRRNFRTAVNRFFASGYVAREEPLASLNAARLRSISESWRRTRTTKCHELRFLVRPVVLADELGVRKFFILDRDGDPKAFAFFDPVYEGGEIAGYLSSTRRWSPETDKLAGYYLMRTAIERFQAEGVRTLYLGLSPFHGIEAPEFNEHWLVREAFQFAYANFFVNRLIYPVRTLAQHKEIYGGASRQTYYAFNTLPSLPRLLKLIWACRIVW